MTAAAVIKQAVKYFLNIADEIVVIADGQITRQGSRDEILPQILGTASVVDACSKFYQGGER